METKDSIRKLREQNGMTQEQLADALGVTRPAVTQWESGWSLPKIGTLKQMAEIFGVNVGEVIDAGAQTDDTQASGIVLSSTERELIDCYRSMTPRFRTELLSLARTMADNGMAKNNTVSEEGIA